MNDPIHTPAREAVEVVEKAIRRALSNDEKVAVLLDRRLLDEMDGELVFWDAMADPPKEAIVGPTVLDEWADHIAYLQLPETCRLQHHPTRVARLGSAITPLRFAYDADPNHPEPVEERIRTIREAVAYLARETGPQGPPSGPAASIVYRLLAGVLAPETAIQEIRALLTRPLAIAVHAEAR